MGLARRSENIEANAKKLEKEKGKLYAIKTDISQEEDILKAFKWISETLGPVHILINNAGIVAAHKYLIDGDSDAWRKILDVNVLGLSIATREAVKNMRANNVNGHIIHINSIVGHKCLPHPGANMYPASKHAVTALTETLRIELNSVKSKIKITVSRNDVDFGRKFENFFFRV